MGLPLVAPLIRTRNKGVRGFLPPLGVCIRCGLLLLSMPVLIVKSVHRMAACSLIWRTFDRPFASESDYQSMIDEIAEKLAQNRLVIMRRIGDEIIVTSRK